MSSFRKAIEEGTIETYKRRSKWAVKRLRYGEPKSLHNSSVSMDVKFKGKIYHYTMETKR